MPGKRPKVTLCAALTADGRLDTEVPLATTLRHVPAPGEDEEWLVDEEMIPHLPAAFLRPPRIIDLAGIRNLPRSLGLTLPHGRPVVRWICLGGPRLFRALLDARLVNDLCLLVRPRIDGRRGAATLSGVPGEFFPASIHLRLLKMEVRGGECLLHYRVRRTPAKPRVAA